LAKVGDFDGDGRTDIYWLSVSGRDFLWRGRSDARFSRVVGAPQHVGGRHGFVGDFDGDGRDDVFWYEPGSTADRLWLGTVSGFALASAVRVAGRFRPAAGDFNADGRADVVWYSPTRSDRLWRGRSDGTFEKNTPRVSLAGDFLPRVADFNGDHHDDIYWHAPGPDPDRIWHGK